MAYDGSMTSETRHLVGMADIRGVEITCRNVKCKSKVVMVTNATDDLPMKCAVCSHSFFDADHDSWSATSELHKAIRYLLNHKIDCVRLDIAGVKSE